MIDITIFTEKLDIAKQQKDHPNYRKKIQLELSKPEWQQQKFELDRQFSNIKDEQDFQKYQKALARLFEDIYEVITAPGVDNFIGWINEITDHKKNLNAKKLRDYLVENFTESTISSSIESVLSNKDGLSKEKSIFFPLLNEIQKEIKKRCHSFLDKPAEFANNIKEFLEDLTTDLSGVAEIVELSYSDLRQFYKADQISNKIDFYYDIFKLIVEKNQNLKPINDIDKGLDLLIKVKNRITDIVKCIALLNKTGLANNSDINIRNLFLKFDKEMVNYEKGIFNSLDEFIDKTWSDIESNYNQIKSFFEKNNQVTYSGQWDTFSKKDEIKSLILLYSSLLNDAPLTTILSRATSDIPKLLSRKATALDKYNTSATQLKEEIAEVFRNFIKEYEGKKMPLLDSLSSGTASLKTITGKIKLSIEGINNGLKSLELRTDVMEYLNEDFLSDLNTYNDIRNWFENALQQSGMNPHLIWLESKLNGSGSGSISIIDFNNPGLIKELLEKGLIKIEIEKTF